MSKLAQRVAKAVATGQKSDKLIQVGSDGGPLTLGVFTFQRRGVEIHGDPSLAEWSEAFAFAKTVEDGALFWLGDLLKHAENRGDWGETYTQALDTTDYAYQTIADAVWVCSQIEFSRRREKLSYSIHHEVASLTTIAEQDKLLDRAESDQLSTRDVRQVVKRLRRGAKLEAATWPEGKYGVILMDPPWRPDEGLLDPTREIENQYPTMTVDELCAMQAKIDALAGDDCVLLMWTTAQKIGEAVEILNAWGFTVKSGAVWVKGSIGMGYWFRSRHELLILATRGEPMTPLEPDRADSVIVAERRGHSEKPDELYDVIERMFPSIPKVEVFARAERDGWGHVTNEPTLRSA